jgi:hypothetical protein
MAPVRNGPVAGEHFLYSAHPVDWSAASGEDANLLALSEPLLHPLDHRRDGLADVGDVFPVARSEVGERAVEVDAYIQPFCDMLPALSICRK